MEPLGNNDLKGTGWDGRIPSSPLFLLSKPEQLEGLGHTLGRLDVLEGLCGALWRGCGALGLAESGSRSFCLSSPTISQHLRARRLLRDW